MPWGTSWHKKEGHAVKKVEPKRREPVKLYNLILLAASLGALLVGILGEWTYPRWNRWHQ